MAHPKQTIADNDSNHTNDSIVRGKRAPHHHGQPAGKTFVYNDSNRTNDNTVRGNRAPHHHGQPAGNTFVTTAVTAPTTTPSAAKERHITMVNPQARKSPTKTATQLSVLNFAHEGAQGV